MVKNKMKCSTKLIIASVVVTVCIIGVISYLFIRGFKASIIGDDTVQITETKQVTETESSELSTEDQTTASTPTTPTTVESTTPPIDNGESNLIITQWGIAGYYNGSNHIEYEITNGISGKRLIFTSPDFAGTGRCTSETKIFFLDRYSDGEMTSPMYSGDGPQSVSVLYNQGYSNGYGHIKKIGDYYYMLWPSHSDVVCLGVESDELLMTNSISAIRNFFQTLVAV